MNNIAIKVNHLTKIYKLYNKPIDRLKESLHPLKKQYHKDFFALNDVSFEIKKGETVGIIGKNGAGKSTLLKIITGVLTPSSGHVHTNGRIASLLELGAGFNPEYTGIENIYLQGTLMGYSHDEMKSKIEDILSFADIGDFVHQPVKMYSSGMFARLAFSVAINVEPEILIVDEALSVGDTRFQQKCYRKFREFQDSNKTILFVTHDTSSIVNYCSRSIWINDGRKEDEGDPKIICKRYMSMMAYDKKTENIVHDLVIKNGNDIIDNLIIKNVDSIQWIDTDGLESFGDKRILITGISLFDANNNAKNLFSGNEEMVIKIKFYSTENINNLIPGFTVYDYLGNAVFGANTALYDNKDVHFKEKNEHIVSFKFIVPLLKNGEYNISPAIAEGTLDEHIQQHWVHNAIQFKINTIDYKSLMGWTISIENMIIEVK
jgi:ABC-type polysaccharide/polyol phosphate transport system ATPase subunit